MDNKDDITDVVAKEVGVVVASTRGPEVVRYGKWDTDVEIYRGGDWRIAPMSSIRSGDAFQMLERNANGEVVGVARCFLARDGAKVNYHTDRSKDPDIVIGSVEIVTRESVERDRGSEIRLDDGSTLLLT